MSESSPPPYRSDTAPTERTIHAAQQPTPLHLTSIDIAGLRAQILDNAPSLFLMAHVNTRMLPSKFLINTVRDPPNSGGKSHASVVFQQPGLKGATVVAVFVHGPKAESTEGALRALLEKIEGMVGRKWKEAEQKGVLLSKGPFYVASIDD